MAINIRFDLSGNPEPPTIILANRNGNKLGQLDVNPKSIELTDRFNDASELSFTLNKYTNGKLTNLWDKVVDFKLVYCKEWDCWFEITVELDEATETVKTVFCTQLGHAELSQIMLYNIEINTEDDILRDDYEASVLYNGNKQNASILNRMLEKAPHYSVAYVDPTIAKIQRSFSFDDTSIYDAFQEIAEEIGCIFVFPSNSGVNGKIKREIYVYDLKQYCNDCGHRGEFTDKCTECGSTNITKGYGDDTLILVTSDELASEEIELTIDTGSVKNCFKLEAGDDLMTATVRNCNPNGTDYIWRISDHFKEDMSDELVEKLNSYDELNEYYSSEHIYELDKSLINKYNEIVYEYAEFNKNLQEISDTIKGYPSLMNAYYNTIDLYLYLKSGLTPMYDPNSSPKESYLIDEYDNFLIDELNNYLTYKRHTILDETSAKNQAKLLTADAMSPVSVSNINNVSLATLNSTVLSVAKILIRPTYKVQVKTSEMSENGSIKIWTGNFEITNYSNEEDTAISEVISIVVNDDYENFIKQKIEKALSKENSEDFSITELFSKNHDEFCETLKYYALNFLLSFRDACQSCIDILIEQGVGNDATWSDNTAGAEGNLYENLYTPYYNKLKAIEAEIKIRENQINLVTGTYNVDGTLIADGLQSLIEKCRSETREALDFEKYLGTQLWLEFCSYRREDKYSNDNYISDGLDNAELFKKAQDFFETAKDEIYKSSELQHSISTTLNNLLAIEKFKPLIKSFNVGNWIRLLVDDKMYKLRLLEYTISFDDFRDIPVEFSDVVKIKDSASDIASTLSQASSMASSYSYVKRQANQGEKSNAVLNSWADNGLNATNTKIVSTDNQNQVWDKNGILCREYDPVTEGYSDEQLKIINSTIAITDDNWKSTKTAIGRYYYTDPDTKELKSTYGVNGETVVGKLLIGERLDISNGKGDLQFGANGLVVKNETNTISMNPNNRSLFDISNNDKKIFSINESGELVIRGNITASSLTLLDGTTIGTGSIDGLSNAAISGDYSDLHGVPTKLSDFENDGVFITKDADDLANYYKKIECDNMLSQKANTSSLASVATSGSYNDLKDIQDLKNWVLQQIQAAVNGQNNWT